MKGIAYLPWHPALRRPPETRLKLRPLGTTQSFEIISKSHSGGQNGPQLFTALAPLGRLSHRVAMSVCPFVPSDDFFVWGLSFALRSHDQFRGLSLVHQFENLETWKIGNSEIWKPPAPPKNEKNDFQNRTNPLKKKKKIFIYKIFFFFFFI